MSHSGSSAARLRLPREYPLASVRLRSGFDLALGQAVNELRKTLLLLWVAGALPQAVHAYSSDTPWREHCSSVARALPAVVQEAEQRRDRDFLRTPSYRAFNRVAEGREHVTTRLLFEYAQIRHGIFKTALPDFHRCIQYLHRD